MADMYHALAEIEHDAKARVYAKHGFRAKAQKHAARAAYHAAFGAPTLTPLTLPGRGLGREARRMQMRENTAAKHEASQQMQARAKLAAQKQPQTQKPPARALEDDYDYDHYGRRDDAVESPLSPLTEPDDYDTASSGDERGASPGSGPKRENGDGFAYADYAARRPWRGGGRANLAAPLSPSRARGRFRPRGWERSAYGV